MWARSKRKGQLLAGPEKISLEYKTELSSVSLRNWPPARRAYAPEGLLEKWPPARRAYASERMMESWVVEKWKNGLLVKSL